MGNPSLMYLLLSAALVYLLLTPAGFGREGLLPSPEISATLTPLVSFPSVISPMAAVPPKPGLQKSSPSAKPSRIDLRDKQPRHKREGSANESSATALPPSMPEGKVGHASLLSTFVDLETQTITAGTNVAEVEESDSQSEEEKAPLSKFKLPSRKKIKKQKSTPKSALIDKEQNNNANKLQISVDQVASAPSPNKKTGAENPPPTTKIKALPKPPQRAKSIKENTVSNFPPSDLGVFSSPPPPVIFPSSLPNFVLGAEKSDINATPSSQAIPDDQVRQKLAPIVQQDNSSRNIPSPNISSPIVIPSNTSPSNVEVKDAAPRPLFFVKGEFIHRDLPLLARGSFGVVYKGNVQGITEKLVIKDIDIQNQHTIDEWQKEIAIMSQNRSPYIADIFGYSQAGNILTIVMEYFPNGDLFSVLHKNPQSHPLSLLQKFRMALHCSLGVHFLHQNNFIHRDIKSLNVLVSSDYRCKLSDFGCAKLINNQQFFHTMNAGTPMWMAPEVKQGVYYLPSDIYSLGLVLYEIFETKLPLYDRERQTAVLPSKFSSSWLVSPTVKLAHERPTAFQITNILHRVLWALVVEMKKHLPKEFPLPSKSTGTFEELDFELITMHSKMMETRFVPQLDEVVRPQFNKTLNEVMNTKQK